MIKPDPMSSTGYVAEIKLMKVAPTAAPPRPPRAVSRPLPGLGVNGKGVGRLGTRVRGVPCSRVGCCLFDPPSPLSLRLSLPRFRRVPFRRARISGRRLPPLPPFLRSPCPLSLSVGVCLLPFRRLPPLFCELPPRSLAPSPYIHPSIPLRATVSTLTRHVGRVGCERTAHTDKDGCPRQRRCVSRRALTRCPRRSFRGCAAARRGTPAWNEKIGAREAIETLRLIPNSLGRSFRGRAAARPRTRAPASSSASCTTPS